MTDAITPGTKGRMAGFMPTELDKNCQQQDNFTLSLTIEDDGCLKR